MMTWKTKDQLPLPSCPVASGKVAIKNRLAAIAVCAANICNYGQPSINWVEKLINTLLRAGRCSK